MVVFYDVVASEIRFIQRKGRTARHREGKVVILYTKETKDEIYFEMALRRLKKMKFNLKNPQELKEYYEQGGVSRRNSGSLTAFPEKESKPAQSTLGPFLDTKKKKKNLPKNKEFSDVRIGKNSSNEIWCKKKVK